MQEFTNMRPNLWLKRERELRGWTQQYVAEQLDVPLASVRDWEDGFMAPNSDYRERLCILYQKDAEALGLNEEMYRVEELSIPSQNSTALPIIEGEKLRLKDRRKRGNIFNIGIILLVLAVILLPSLWFLVAKAQPPNPNATPSPQSTSTTQLSPTNSLSTPSPSQTSRTTLPGKTPSGVTTASTSGPVTATSTIQGGLPPPTGLGTPTPTSGLTGSPGMTPTGIPLSPTTIPSTATPTPTPTATPCLAPTETIGVTITVTDTMQSSNSPCYDAPTGTHRVDYARGAANPVMFITDQLINGDSNFAGRTYANSNAPSIVWRCSNIATFRAITYFNNTPSDPDFTFQYSTSPMSASAVQWIAIPGVDAPATLGSTDQSGWRSRTYTLTNLPSAGVNDIEIGWSTAATTTTNKTPLIGQVSMQCTGGY